MEKQADYCLKKWRRKMPKTSARRSQLIALCRKKRGKVRKGKQGKRLKRWQDEKWVSVNDGGKKPCGTGKNHYCRPSKRVSEKTPKTIGELSKGEKDYRKCKKKIVGMGDYVRIREKK